MAKIDFLSLLATFQEQPSIDHQDTGLDRALLTLAQKRDFKQFRQKLRDYYQENLQKGLAPDIALSNLHAVLMKSAVTHDKDTSGHILRVGVLSGFVAHKMERSTEFCIELMLAAPLHDIGKIATPDEILKKPSDFNDEEKVIMKRHAGHGYQMLRGIKGLEMAADIALHHHQKHDGKGYPGRWPAVKIPDAVHYFSPVDIYDALRSKRVYKEPFSHAVAIDILLNGDKEGRIKPVYFHHDVLKVIGQHQEEIENLYHAMTTQYSTIYAPSLSDSIASWRKKSAPSVHGYTK
jgi:HD-GYP domain-containing protein (c-di-GMP phosphodiesterase class II)